MVSERWIGQEQEKMLNWMDLWLVQNLAICNPAFMTKKEMELLYWARIQSGEAFSAFQLKTIFSEHFVFFTKILRYINLTTQIVATLSGGDFGIVGQGAFLMHYRAIVFASSYHVLFGFGPIGSEEQPTLQILAGSLGEPISTDLEEKSSSLLRSPYVRQILFFFFEKNELLMFKFQAFDFIFPFFQTNNHIKEKNTILGKKTDWLLTMRVIALFLTMKVCWSLFEQSESQIINNKKKMDFWGDLFRIVGIPTSFGEVQTPALRATQQVWGFFFFFEKLLKIWKKIV